mgnify:CR=1 FL=1
MNSLNPMKVRCLQIFILLTFILSAFQASANVKPVVIGYVGGYRGLVDAENIDVKKLTHINYAFVNVLKNRAVLSNEATDTINFKNLNALKPKNPSLKILISLGGWSWSENFSDAVLTDTSRRAFAASAVEIIKKYGLDGVDIDWKYPARPGEKGNIYRPEDKQNYTLMFESIRNELDLLEEQTGKKYLLTTAVGGFTSFVDNTEMGKAAKYLDFVNLMTYDYSGGKIAGHHTNLYASSKYPTENFADKAVKAYVLAGVPINKLVLGIAFYSHTYDLAENHRRGIGGKVAKRAAGHNFSFIKDSLINQNGYRYYRDRAAKSPYLYSSNKLQFLSYDDEWSVRKKCEYVKKNKLAGVMFWEYYSDQKGYLLNEITKVLGRNSN